MSFDPHSRVIGVQAAPTLYSATIADGASRSYAVVFVNADRLSAIVTPAGMEGTVLTFQVSRDFGVTWTDLWDPSTGAEVSWTVSAGMDHANPAWGLWKDVTHVKLRTGSSASPTVQTGAAVFTVVGAP